MAVYFVRRNSIIVTLLLLAVTKTVSCTRVRFQSDEADKPPSFSRDSTLGTTPLEWGVVFGSAHPDNNLFSWFDYIHPNQARIFLQPFIPSGNPKYDTRDWRQFVSNSWDQERMQEFGDQYGKSFSGAVVDSADSFLNAVDDFRAKVRNTPGGKSIVDALSENTKEIEWSIVLNRLSELSTGSELQQQGIPIQYLRKLRDRGVKVVAVWDVDCLEVPFESSDASFPPYFGERWELYRTIYVGGAWMAEQGIDHVELANEPDKSKCMSPSRWKDSVRIKSKAIQDAFIDYNARLNVNIIPEIIAPSTASAWHDDYSNMTIDNMKKPFPDGSSDPNWQLANAYSFHRYGAFSKKPCNSISESCAPSHGYYLRENYEKAEEGLGQKGVKDMDVFITEFNCYPVYVMENKEQPFMVGKHVMDEPSTGSCLGAQISYLMALGDGPMAITLFKLVQNGAKWLPSGVVRNGILYGDTEHRPFHISGSSKAAEVYRLMISKAYFPGTKSGGVPLVAVPSDSHDFLDIKAKVVAYGIRDSKIIFVYITNDNWKKEDVRIDAKSLGAASGSNVVVTAVGYNPKRTSTYHGEVSDIFTTGNENYMSFSMPPSTVYMVTIPTVSSRQETMAASDAVAVTPKGAYTDSGSFSITSSSSAGIDSPSIIALKFPDYTRSKSSILHAVLNLHLRESTNSRPEILTILGIGDDWSSNTASWSSLSFLKDISSDSFDFQHSKDNFVKWGNGVTVVGHLTVPPSSAVGEKGSTLRFDVTEHIKNGLKSFIIVRLIRYNRSGGLPQDVPEGLYNFASLSDSQFAPKILLEVS